MEIDRSTVNRWFYEAHQELKKSGDDYDFTDSIVHVAQRAAEAERERLAQFFDMNDSILFWGSQAAKHVRDSGITKDQA